ncbi:MAG: FAD-dependent monooxygenase [Acidiferrobacteraceae bacterium]
MSHGEDTDIVIAGAGPVGSVLACALAASGWQVALCERGGLPAEPLPGRDRRGLALTVASQRILAHLGVWALLTPGSVAEIRRMRVCEDGASVTFDAAEIGRSDLGYVVEYEELMAALTRRMRAHPDTISHRAGDAGQWIASSHDGELRLAAGDTLRARLAVASDGAHSLIRGSAGIGLKTHPYHETAITTIVRTRLPHGHEAWQRFLPEGPLALLPLPDPGERSLIWSLAEERARELCALGNEAFADALRAACGDEFGEMSTSVPRQTFPLVRARARRYIGERLALAGDAAHRVHPLAGQGVNLGFADAATLAEVLIDARAAGRDPGAHAVLRRYERWRRSANTPMLAAIDLFHDLFPRPGRIWGRTRRTGLRAFDTLTPIKREVMRYASGIKGDLPFLARSCGQSPP